MSGSRRITHAAAILAALALAVLPRYLAPAAQAQGGVKVPRYRVDPTWPKQPFTTVKDDKGVLRQWVSGDVGGACLDPKNDHIITVNRAYQNNITDYERKTAMPMPPVVEFDQQGNVVMAWSDKAKLTDKGVAAILPSGGHGCFVDYQVNIWIGGSERHRAEVVARRLKCCCRLARRACATHRPAGRGAGGA